MTYYDAPSTLRFNASGIRLSYALYMHYNISNLAAMIYFYYRITTKYHYQKAFVSLIISYFCRLRAAFHFSVEGHYLRILLAAACHRRLFLHATRDATSHATIHIIKYFEPAFTTNITHVAGECPHEMKLL